MGPISDLEPTVAFPLTREAPGSARRWLAGTGLARPALIESASLLVSELVSNSVVHSGLSAPETVAVSARSTPRGLHVEVIDEGVGIGDVIPRRAGSYGLRLVERTADRWGYSDHPTRVWFELDG